MRWQPIETAPKDTVIDLFRCWPKNRAGFTGFRYADCYWNESKQLWITKNADSESPQSIVKNPDFWMHIPRPPDFTPKPWKTVDSQS